MVGISPELQSVISYERDVRIGNARLSSREISKIDISFGKYSLNNG